MDPKRPISTDAAPAPVGPYSQAIASGSLLLVSGQVGIDPATGAAAGPDIATQTRQALENLFAVAQAGGASPRDAVRLGVFLSDMTAFKEFNDVYAELVPEPRPARVTVGADLGVWLVEIDGMFRIPGTDD
ncbi:MAG TPA: Rid family detoxifying hydrolase [Solirubrobacteraceae bacterium]|nr:Rid family detoxifying hydrolase [Solirubrobacteraceae bacterium]